MICSLVNGSFDPGLSALDRGLLYGDGLFETMRVEAGAVRAWDAHHTRLVEGCRRLGISAPERATLESEIGRLVSMAPGRAVLKLIVTRGQGGRGYRPLAGAAPTRILQLHQWPHYTRDWFTQGVEVCLCKTRLGINPSLAGLKHLNRLEQVLARGEWADEFAEGLMHDAEGRLVEGTMSNLFLVQCSGRLVTPALTRCGVRGIMRGAVIELARASGWSVDEVDVTLEDLLGAEGAFLTNSIIGIWPIRALGDRRWPVHPICIKLGKSLGVPV